MYSAWIIVNCEISDKDGKSAIPSCLRNPLSFLYKERKFAAIDRILLNNSPNQNFLKHYIELFSLCTQYEKDHKNINDQFLINYFFETIYCFQTLNYVCQILTEINSFRSSNTEMLQPKDLEGTVLNDILASFLCCPLVYSRSFLLNHTYKTILDSDLSKAYLEHAANVRMSYTYTDPTADNKIKKTIQALSLMNDFIKTINNYTIPLLEDLWDVITSELTDTSGNSIINSNDYEQYLEDYRNILTLDYTCLSDNDIDDCIYQGIEERTYDNLQDETFNIGFRRKLCLSRLNKRLESCSKKRLESKTDDFLNMYRENISAYTKESLQTILKHSLTPNRFNKDINSALFPDAKNDCYFASENFKLNHAKELYKVYL